MTDSGHKLDRIWQSRSTVWCSTPTVWTQWLATNFEAAPQLPLPQAEPWILRITWWVGSLHTRLAPGTSYRQTGCGILRCHTFQPTPAPAAHKNSKWNLLGKASGTQKSSSKASDESNWTFLDRLYKKLTKSLWWSKLISECTKKPTVSRAGCPEPSCHHAAARHFVLGHLSLQSGAQDREVKFWVSSVRTETGIGINKVPFTWANGDCGDVCQTWRIDIVSAPVRRFWAWRLL